MTTIELEFGAIDEAVSAFDDVEVSACEVTTDIATGEEYVNRLTGDSDDPEPTFWTVYLHRKAGGAVAVADCPSLELANRLAVVLKDILQAV
jgi:hypothetical protein